MTVIVTDEGFLPTPDRALPSLAELNESDTSVDLANTDDPGLLAEALDRLRLIRVAFPSFADGRAFTIARRLRVMGYKGQLLALGPVISDQYAMCRRVGFDGVEIPNELAERQPAAQWKFRADWQAHDYQSRLRA